MTIVEQTEFGENGYTYIKTVYSNGTIDIHIKSDPIPEPEPEPVDPPVTNEEIKELQLDTLEGIATLFELQIGSISV